MIQFSFYTEWVEAQHPLFLLYTSDSTGVWWSFATLERFVFFACCALP
jgi:hypothetical protein